MTGSVSSFFEGTEKKVEIVVDPSLPSMRGLGDGFWREVVERAGAGVISKICNGCCDAFLLSESSLFVFDHKVVMLTCGQTTLHEAVLAILDVAPPDRIRSLIYERKNEVSPHDQPTSFFEDVRILNKHLPGRAYQFGSRDEHHLYLFHVDRRLDCDSQDTTAEILMCGLDERIRGNFCRTTHPTTRAVRDATGVDRIISGFTVNDHLFEPTGYSLNAINDTEYYAVHVTPEPASSYASFETNHRFNGDLSHVVQRLLETFRPRSYDLVLFDRAAEAPGEAEGYQLKSHATGKLGRGPEVRFMSFYRPQERVERAIELVLESPEAKVIEA